MIGLREDQQVGAQLAARIVIFLNSVTFRSGSGLTRESGGSQTDVLNDTPQSRASPLPQWMGMNVTPVAGSAASKAAG
ncbi:hypothetical protein A7J50_5364 [Pseudomonas antarctica]|jgi:hypothetical protein|uniref:Uncharacterized protein n=1 Tax=Pseudomonas antarctica TaxID=219572 RepID=A0A172Z845_9PSED|nr:hypothetical protein A7J50_5364 [Pseudomonas antarctica]